MKGNKINFLHHTTFRLFCEMTSYYQKKYSKKIKGSRHEEKIENLKKNDSNTKFTFKSTTMYKF